MKKILIILILAVFMMINLFVPAYAEAELTDVQRNSITMMNYLLVMVKEINDSKNSRLFLEDTYNSLISNIHPNAVDSETKDQLDNMLETLETYRLISVKRDRLALLYEKNQAKAIKNAIPNPLGLLSVVESKNPLKIIASIAYMAVDSISSYNSFVEENEMNYLKDGWELTDEEAAELHNSRKMAFDYMIDMVQFYDLPGDLALNEESIDEFIQAKNNSNVYQRIHTLESNRAKYEGYAYYWLLLGESYYEAEEYEKCLEATATYIGQSNRIFRLDYELAKELPMAVTAAREVMNEDDYVKKAAEYAELIIANTGGKNWALRYFAAQTYIDLYALTENKDYLERAYEIVLDNVVYLVSTQRVENSVYLAALEKVQPNKDASKEEEKEIKNFNRMLEEIRKTELSPVYEPLLLNCDLLFDLMNLLNVDEAERTKVDRILHNNGENLFLTDPLDDLYRIGPKPEEFIDVAFEKDEIIKIGDKKSSVLTIPANYVTPDSVIKVSVTDKGVTNEFTDWTVKKVVRKVSGLVESFDVVYSSKSIAPQKYTKDSKVTVTLSVMAGYGTKEYTFDFYVVDVKNVLGAQKVEFRRTSR